MSSPPYEPVVTVSGRTWSATTHSRGEFFRVHCELSPGSVRIEVEDMGGPWRKRKDDNRTHGLDIVEALTGPGAWGTKTINDGGRAVWAVLSW